jgi:hypothetical protein
MPAGAKRLSRPVVGWVFSVTTGIAGLATQIFDNLVGRRSNVRQNFESNRGDNRSGSFHSLSGMGSDRESHKIKREFDPGSESTLAARLTHASRTRKWSNP